MKLYRYEFESGCEHPHTGILTGLDDICDDYKEILDLCAYFEDNLRDPEIYGGGTLSFFTEAGNVKFKNAIDKIKCAAESKGINTICIVKDYSEMNIIYEDIYQIAAVNTLYTK